MTNEPLTVVTSNNGARGVHVERVTASASPRSRLRGVVERAGSAPYDGLLWRLHTGHRAADAGALMVGVAGSERRVGATTIAASLAVRASELGMGPVLLVETDVERPQLREMWKLPAGPGLAELLHEAASLSDCAYGGPAEDLRVLPAAARQTRGLSHWRAEAASGLLAEAAADYALVLIDLPPADRMQHAVELARRLDQVLLVVRAEQTRQQQAVRAAAWLSDCGVPLSGTILNRKRRYFPAFFDRWF